MNLTIISQLWSIVLEMLQQVIELVSTYPLLVALIVAVPIIGLGIGLFKRLIR